MKVWSYFAAGHDGRLYNVRLLLSDEELRGLQRAGVVPDTVHQVEGLQDAADSLVADLERQALPEGGWRLQ